jgi:7-cyano-7-deazaguanine synthase
MVNNKAIVLLSGGLDSSTTLAVAKSDGFDVYTLSFDYGQRHKYELISTQKISRLFNASNHLIIKFDLRAIGGSALTANIDVPENRSLGEMSQDVPITYVPARNTIFLSFALAWAEILRSYDIFIGVNALDYSGYPDCRPEYIEAYQKMANLATKEGIEGRHMRIHTPLINLKKSEIIEKGVELGVDYSLTHSCYNPTPNGLACGKCDSCLLRKQGFKEAGIQDPTRYAKI